MHLLNLFMTYSEYGMQTETECAYPEYFNGYCPESWLKGKTVYMRLIQMIFLKMKKQVCKLQFTSGCTGSDTYVARQRSIKLSPRYAHETELGDFYWNNVLTGGLIATE